MSDKANTSDADPGTLNVEDDGAKRVEYADAPMDLSGKAPAEIGDPHDPTAGRGKGHTSEANPD